MRFEILELFVNTLTTDDKYSSRNIQNLTQQLQTTMSEKQKTFYRIFITYVKSRTSSDDFVKFIIFRREYLSSAPNVLKNGPKLSILTKAGVFQLYLSHINGKIR